MLVEILKTLQPLTDELLKGDETLHTSFDFCSAQPI